MFCPHAPPLSERKLLPWRRLLLIIPKLFSHRYGRMLVLLYALVEVRAYLWLQQQKSKLAAFRNSMAPQFPYAAWRRWFATKLRHEARVRPRMMRQWIEQIFWNTPLESLPRRDVESWLSMFLDCTVDAPSWVMPVISNASGKTETEVVNGLVDEFEDKFGVTFSTDSATPTKDFIRINSMATDNSPMTPMFEPLPVRLLRRGLRCATNLYLSKGLKFEAWHDDQTGVVYWYAPDQLTVSVGACDSLRREVPMRGLVFYHGFGCGATPYLPLLRLLRARYCSGPLIVAEMPGISGLPPRDYTKMRTTPFPRADELAQSAANLKARLRIQHLDAIGHSFGCLVISYVNKYAPDVFDRILIFESQVFFFENTCFWQLIFKRYSLLTIFDYLVRGEVMNAMSCFALGEVWHQHVMRHAVWFMEFLRWSEHEVRSDSKTTAMFARRDHVVPIGIVQWLAQEHPDIKVQTYEGFHGQSLLPHNCNRTVDLILDLLMNQVT